MSEESKRQIAKGIATAAIELAVIRSELCREDAPPLMPEECAEVVRDAWNAMQGIDTCLAEPCEELLAFDKLLEERNAAMTALESLTPGGSEYVGDIRRCVQDVLDTRSNMMGQLRKLVDERDAARAVSQAALREAEDASHREFALREQMDALLEAAQTAAGEFCSQRPLGSKPNKVEERLRAAIAIVKGGNR